MTIHSIIKKAVILSAFLLILIPGVSKLHAAQWLYFYSGNVGQEGCQGEYAVLVRAFDQNGTETALNAVVPGGTVRLTTTVPNYSLIYQEGWDYCTDMETVYPYTQKAYFGGDFPSEPHFTSAQRGQEFTLTIPSSPDQPDGTYALGVWVESQYDAVRGGGGQQHSYGTLRGDATIYLTPTPTTAQVTVNSCPQGGSWSLSPGTYSTSGNVATVQTSSSGQSYTLNYTAPSGYHISNISPATSQLVYPNNNYTFTVTCAQTVDQPVPPPTGPVGSCSADGTTGTFSWTAPSGYNTFFTRAQDTTTGANMGSPAWDNNYVGTSKSFTTVPGHTYSWWVHTKESDVRYSSAIGSSFTCANPTCPANQHWNGSACVWDSCPANQTRDANGVCQWNACTGSGVTRDASGNCTVCPSGQHISMYSGNCIYDNFCTTGWHPDPAHPDDPQYCIPDSCPPGYEFNASGNACVPSAVSIHVQSNVSSAGWTISPQSRSGTGTGNASVTPGNSGTLFTITPSAVSGYDFPPTITNSVTGSGSSMMVFPNDSPTFTLTYTSFAYTLSNGGNVTVMKGGIDQYGQTTVTKTRTSGTTQSVNLSLSGVPSNVDYSIAQQTCSPNCTSTITFTVHPSAVAGVYPITVTGTPGSMTTNFNLTINNSPNLIVSCSANPASALVGQPVTWTANASGGSGTGYTYTWSGSSIPTTPAPTQNPYTITYTTVGAKTASAHVVDSIGNVGNCIPAGSIQINFNPEFQEF